MSHHQHTDHGHGNGHHAGQQAKGHGSYGHGHAAADAALATDPVCGMRVDPAASKHRAAPWVRLTRPEVTAAS